MHYEEARQIFLNEVESAFVNGELEIEVLHGIGKFILKKMIIDEVQKIEYLEIIDTGFNLNPGITRVRILAPEQHLLKEYM